jgi:hypothetical protein
VSLEAKEAERVEEGDADWRSVNESAKADVEITHARGDLEWVMSCAGLCEGDANAQSNYVFKGRGRMSSVYILFVLVDRPWSGRRRKDKRQQ